MTSLMVERAAVVEPIANWHRARRRRVFVEGEEDCRETATLQSSRAGRKRLSAM